MNMMSKKKIVDIAYELKRAFEEKDLKAIASFIRISKMGCIRNR